MRLLIADAVGPAVAPQYHAVLQPALFFGFLGLFNSVIFGAGLGIVYAFQWEVRSNC
jgi:hypothetical protein